jgi:two-component system, response regulator PdtaR
MGKFAVKNKNGARRVVRVRSKAQIEATAMNKGRAELVPLSRTPRRQLPVFAAEREEDAISPNQTARILIVEDDYFVGLQNEDMLTKAGFSVVGVATTADYALTLAAREMPDLVLMDIRLAHSGDGIDAAVKLLQRHQIRSIFVTAHGDSATRSRAVPARPLGWLVKPFTAAALVKAVREALATRRGEGDAPI